MLKPSHLLAPIKINKLRIDLIKEELDELTEAMNNKDLLEVADALTDISICNLWSRTCIWN